MHRGKLVFTPAPRAAPTARESGKACLSVKLDPPFLAVPINCALE
jgi:hypothetical protein